MNCKSTITFNCCCDNEAMRRVLAYPILQDIAFYIRGNLRYMIKHGEYSDETYEALDKVYEDLHQIFVDRSGSLDIYLANDMCE